MARSSSSNSGHYDDHNPMQKMAGYILCLAAFYLMVCLLSYSPADPSLNRASDDEVLNAGGYTGALLADIALQLLGLASALLVIIPMAWGVKIVRAQPLSYGWIRFCLLLTSLVSSSALLANMEPPLSWPINSGLGGAIGAVIYDGLYQMFRLTLFVICLTAITLVMVSLSFGVSWSEWRSIGNGFKIAGLAVLGMLISLVQRTRNRGLAVARDPYEEDVMPFYLAIPYRIMDAVRERVFFWRSEEAYEDEEYEDEDGEYEEDDEEYEEEARPAPRVSKRVVEKKNVRIQSALPLGEFEFPSLKLLTAAPRSKKNNLSQSALTQNAKLLESVLQDFGVNGDIVEIRPGPVVTLYELEPAAGTKSSRVIGLADDIARSMSAISARIAVIPGRNAIGIELPNQVRETVYLREMFESDPYDDSEAKLPLALGKDIGGDSIIVDLARMPHLLVAGTTGSGKSVAINTMIMSLVYKMTPEECKFIMIDPKMLELSIYDGIPHLLSPVVTEPGKAVVALKWTVKEMENRYRLMSSLSVRNVEGYNKKVREARAKGKELTRTVQTGFNPDTGEPIYEETPLDMNELPFIVVVVDEMADLMIVAGKEIEGSIQRLAQMARAAGIHIIMATQRPSVDVITGVIKANFPTRISFQVTSRIDSRTILGEQGAEQLLGQGDMLYMAGGGRITRVHGPFVTDKEVEHIVEHLKAQGSPTYVEDVTKEEDDSMGFEFEDEEKDEYYDRAVAIVTRDRKASTSYIQRCLKIGYNRAASIIEKMERDGVVGPANHVGKREVLAQDVNA